MSKIKILPISPGNPMTFWSYNKPVRYMGKESVMPQTGLPTALGMIPEEHFEIHRVIDTNIEPLRREHFNGIDLALVSSIIVNENSQNEIIDFAHSLGVPVAVGNAFPTVYPERCQNADYIITGEAEITLSAFLEDFLSGTPQRIYTEKQVIEGGRNLANLLRNGKPDLSQTPVPRWDLVDLSKYYTVGVQYSRGCPNQCEFCNIPDLNGRIPRTKSPEQMIKELEALRSLGFKGDVFFLDDNLIGNKKALREFLPILAEYRDKTGFPRSIFTQSSLELAWPENEDLLELMVRAGIDTTFLGLESPDSDVLREMNKIKNLKMSPLESVRKIQRAGIEVMAGFIIGNDQDKPSVFEDMFNFIQETGIRVPMVGLLTAGKGTPLYDRLQREGRLKGDTSGNNTYQLSFNFVPKLDERFLIDGYVNLQSELFEPRNYYARCRTLRKDVGNREVNTPVNLEGIIALAKSLKNHLFAKGGWEYAKYEFGTLLTKPSFIPESISHAIVREHFETIVGETQQVHKFYSQVESWYEHFSEYIGQVSSKYGAELEQTREKVSRRAQKVLAKADKRYRQLHEDFRGEAKKAYDDLRERINQELERYNIPGLRSVSV